MAQTRQTTLDRLEERCRGQGIRLMYGELTGEGGLCRLHDRHIIIINRRSSNATRVRMITEALERLEARVRAQASEETAPAQAEAAAGIAEPVTDRVAEPAAVGAGRSAG